jgi:DNA-binding NtrC family response regulator
MRERSEAIPLLLQYFLRRAKTDMGKKDILGISPSAFELLLKYDWPGNVRQLQSAVRHSMINTTGTVIGVDNLPSFVNGDVSARAEKAASYIDIPNELEAGTASKDEAVLDSDVDGACEGAIWSRTGEEFQLFRFIDDRLVAGSTNIYAEALEHMERHLFAIVLDATCGNQSKTAELLGITRGKVRDRIAAFEILLERKVSIGKQ